MSRISDTFSALRSKQQMAFMPFVTAGDPDLETTQAVLRTVSRHGADLIEIGFPYSDPIADGPVIQASYTRALNNKVHVSGIFDAVGALTREADLALPPLVAMVSYAIIFRVGTDSFLKQAAAAGFSGLIVPDLPGDEAGDFARQVRAAGLDLVQLVSPLTPPDRAEKILTACSGFVYCISVAGTTGVRDELPQELTEQLKWLRTKTSLPLAVGFGISRPEQVATLRGLADGIIVGSAIVRKFEKLANGSSRREAMLREIGEFVAGMASAAHEG